MGPCDRTRDGVDRTCTHFRHSGTSRRPVRERDEAPRRGEGLRDLASRPWWSPRPARWPGASGCAYGAEPATGIDVMRKIAILGATGSIGKSTLDLVDRSPERFEVVAVTASTNAE